jgi:Ran GTPase-activating protein (RanGAP) involved in mRNA processing and transport
MPISTKKSIIHQLQEICHRLKENDPSLLKVVMNCSSRSVLPSNVTDFQRLAQAFHENTVTTHFAIRNLTMTMALGESLANIIQHNTTLTCLSLSDIQPTHPEAILVILRALTCNTTLETIDLQAMCIDSVEAAALLARMLETNQVLRELKLNHNTFNSQACRELKRGLQATASVSRLDLENTGLNEECVKGLANGLEHYTSIEFLGLDLNGISDAGVSALASMLSTNSTLRELHLFGNGISDVGAMELACALQVNTTLRVLNLSFNKIHNEGVTALFQACETNATLQRLELASNPLDKGVIVALSESLANMHGLIQVNLGNLIVNDDDAKSIFRGLQHNFGLEKLSLDCKCRLGDKIQNLLVANRAGRRILRYQHVALGLWLFVLE